METVAILKKGYILSVIIFTAPTIALCEYDRTSAANYANTWWNNRNSTNPNQCDPYKDYTCEDCANFVSQCLKAGGLTLSGNVDACGCHYNCDNLALHLYSGHNAEWTTITWPSTNYPSNMEKGDVIIFGDISGDWYKHAVIVVSGTGGSFLRTLIPDIKADRFFV